jgi:hypothetical protein
MLYILAALIIFLIIVLFFCLKFALIIIHMQDVLEESLDIIDVKYKNISKILEIPIFYNSPEIKSVIAELLDVKRALLYIANQLMKSNKLTEIVEVDNIEKSNKESYENY